MEFTAERQQTALDSAGTLSIYNYANMQTQQTDATYSNQMVYFVWHALHTHTLGHVRRYSRSREDPRTPAAGGLVSNLPHPRHTHLDESGKVRADCSK